VALEALAVLPGDEREALVLRLSLELDYVDVGDLLDVPAATARALVRSGLSRLDVIDDPSSADALVEALRFPATDDELDAWPEVRAAWRERWGSAESTGDARMPLTESLARRMTDAVIAAGSAVAVVAVILLVGSAVTGSLPVPVQSAVHGVLPLLPAPGSTTTAVGGASAAILPASGGSTATSSR
jgi:hypothetical protein